MADVHNKPPVETFLISDQPFVCPNCGCRSESLASFMHTTAPYLVERCLNLKCSFMVIVEEDEEYLKLWKAD